MGRQVVWKEPKNWKLPGAADPPKRNPKLTLAWIVGIGAIVVTSVVVGTVFALKSKGGDSSPSVQDQAAASALAADTFDPRALVNATSPSPAALTSPSPAPSPTAVPSPSPLPSPSPAAVPSPALLPSPEPVALPSPSPASPMANGNPPGAGDYPLPSPLPIGMFVFNVSAEFAGTCALKVAGSNARCVDHMDDGATLAAADSELQAMEDVSQAQKCGFIPVDKIVDDLTKYTFKSSKCVRTGYTVTRACVNGPDGQWRLRAMLWSDNCTPTCVKARGKGDEAVDYGRTLSC
eukprot:scaffold7.g3676.t1